MTPRGERRLLQIAMAAACLVPLSAGALGIASGAGWMRNAPGDVDLDSHMRYLSGLLFGIGVAFAASIRGVERHGARLRLLGAIVVAGGLARLGSAWVDGWPGSGHRLGLAMELLATPAILLWQMRVARRVGSMSGR